MNLQQFKDELKKADFSPKALEALNIILDKAIKKGELGESEKNQLSEIISIESEALNIEADALKNIREGLNNYDQEIEKAANQADQEIEKLDKSFSDNISNIVNQAKISHVREKIKGV